MASTVGWFVARVYPAASAPTRPEPVRPALARPALAGCVHPCNTCGPSVRVGGPGIPARGVGEGRAAIIGAFPMH